MAEMVNDLRKPVQRHRQQAAQQRLAHRQPQHVARDGGEQHPEHERPHEGLRPQRHAQAEEAPQLIGAH